MQHHFVEARDLDEAHFLVIKKCFEAGRVYTIDRGSFEGQMRLEIPHVTVQINHPGARPLAPQVPQGIPAPTSEEEIEKYFVENLMCETPGSYGYSYGQYIVPQLDPVVSMLTNSPGTNQALVTIGGPQSIYQKDPPCLRVLDCRIDQDNKLHFVLYFRSWDVWAGLPQNLGGMQLLKEYLAALTGTEDGGIIATSKGAHLYDYQWPVALARLRGGSPTCENCHRLKLRKDREHA